MTLAWPTITIAHVPGNRTDVFGAYETTSTSGLKSLAARAGVVDISKFRNDVRPEAA